MNNDIWGLNGLMNFDGFPDSGKPVPPQPAGRIVWNKGAAFAAVIGALVGIALEIVLNLFLLNPKLAANPTMYNIVMIGTAAMLVCGGAFAGLIMHSVLRSSRLTIKRALMIPIALLGILVLGGFLQYLYSLGDSSAGRQADDFIFLIDDSGSMRSTDPDNERVSVMRYLLRQWPQDKRVGMVFFTSSITYSHDLTYLNDTSRAELENAVQYLRSEGNTMCQIALDYALSMRGVDDPNRLTEIVYITDGAGGSLDISAAAEICDAKNARISAIFVKDRSAMRVIRRLVNRTGGSMYTVDDLDELLNVYNKVMINLNQRNLLGIRQGKMHGSIPAALLRTFSWVVIGAAFGFAVMLTFAAKGSTWHLPIVSGLAGMVFGLILELFNLLWLDFTLWGSEFGLVLSWIICITILYYEKLEPISYEHTMPVTIPTMGEALDPAQWEIKGKNNKTNGRDILG